MGAWLAPAQEPASRPAPAIEYRVSCELGDDARVHVDMRVRDLDRARRDVRLELPGWGEWYDLDDYYVRNLRSVPPSGTTRSSSSASNSICPSAGTGRSP